MPSVDINADQVAFWQYFVKAVAGALPGTDPANFIVASGRVNSNLGSDTEEIALADAYNIGNTIPNWNLTWNGAFNNKLFGTYSQWVRNLVEGIDAEQSKTADTKLDDQINDIKDKIEKLSDEVGKLTAGIRSDWLDNVCQDLDDSGKACKVYYSNPPNPSWSTFLQQEKDSDNYKAKVEVLENTYGSLLAGLTNQLNDLLLKKFGSNFQRLAEASNTIAAADPDMPHTDNELLKPEQFQMTIKENDATASVPRFVTSELQNVRDWLRQQKATATANNGPLYGDNAKVKVILSDSEQYHTESTWHFSANLGFPVDFFWAGGSTDDSGSKQYTENSSYEVTITYQDVITVNVRPGDWFFEDLISTYSQFADWPDNCPFKGNSLWGQNGMMNIVIKGVVLGYAPYLKVVSKDWNNTTTKTQWSAKASFGIGPFNFESASASGSDYSSDTHETDGGFEVKTSSQVPVIIGFIVDTPNSGSVK
jgi:hypothetical protein